MKMSLYRLAFSGLVALGGFSSLAHAQGVFLPANPEPPAQAQAQPEEPSMTDDPAPPVPSVTAPPVVSLPGSATVRGNMLRPPEFDGPKLTAEQRARILKLNQAGKALNPEAKFFNEGSMVDFNNNMMAKQDMIKARIKRSCGADVPVIVDPGSFMRQLKASARFNETGAAELGEVFGAVCSGTSDTETFRNSVFALVVRHSPKIKNAKVSLSSGMLTIEDDFSRPEPAGPGAMRRQILQMANVESTRRADQIREMSAPLPLSEEKVLSLVPGMEKAPAGKVAPNAQTAPNTKAP